jgi:3-methyladenine DNA glycosylase AlkD
MQCADVLTRLRSLANPRNVEGMARYGISTHDTLGITIYDLRKIAKEIGRDHALAIALWNSGIHEARILASYVAEPARATEALLERWVQDFDSWDVCDQVADFIARTPFVQAKIREWAERPEEFVKRAAFALICELSVHDQDATNEELARFFPLIARAADDERNYVKKAVNWALRNLGKRNRVLNRQAIATARAIARQGTRSARWIASDALRELTSEKAQARLTARAKTNRPRRA